jgi:hypothetical protein
MRCRSCFLDCSVFLILYRDDLIVMIAYSKINPLYQNWRKPPGVLRVAGSRQTDRISSTNIHILVGSIRLY